MSNEESEFLYEITAYFISWNNLFTALFFIKNNIQLMEVFSYKQATENSLQIKQIYFS